MGFFGKVWGNTELIEANNALEYAYKYGIGNG